MERSSGGVIVHAVSGATEHGVALSDRVPRDLRVMDDPFEDDCVPVDTVRLTLLVRVELAVTSDAVTLLENVLSDWDEDTEPDAVVSRLGDGAVAVSDRVAADDAVAADVEGDVEGSRLRDCDGLLLCAGADTVADPVAAGSDGLVVKDGKIQLRRCGPKAIARSPQFHVFAALVGGNASTFRQLYQTVTTIHEFGGVLVHAAFTPTSPVQEIVQNDTF